MWRSKRWERTEATVTRLRPISLWLLLPATVVIVAVALLVTFWLYGIAGDDPARRIEAIKTGLSAAAGTGGALALLLAFRRQRSTEQALVQTDHDATERRITELYTKAADQLGSDQAPVRLAGLHALERLAQNIPGQRQAIVDVICAYLRMPYTPPDKQPLGEDASVEARTCYENRCQELQVRLTAQRILVAHLRPDEGTFWPGIDLDLTQTYLHTFDLADCHVGTAQFEGAQFTGEAKFNGTHFDGGAVFTKARFGKDAEFNHVHFHETARFSGARFGKFSGGPADSPGCATSTRFEDAQFHGAANFSGARFGGGYTVFNSAHFNGSAVFTKARFGGRASFIGAHFTGGDAWFDLARFAGDARFDFAEFAGDAWFYWARFAGYTWFENEKTRQQFSKGVEFSGARVASGIRFCLPTGWTTRAAQPTEGEKEGWLYVIRVENKDEQQPYQEDRSDSEAGTSGT